MWYVYSLSHVWLFATPWTVAHQAPRSMGILQARILEWVAMPSSRGNPRPRSLALQAESLPSKSPGKPKNTGVGSLSLLQGTFPTKESNWGLQHYKHILYGLSYQGSPIPLQQTPINVVIFHWLLSTALLPGTIRYFRMVWYSFYRISRISPFSREFWFLQFDICLYCKSRSWRRSNEDVFLHRCENELVT